MKIVVVSDTHGDLSLLRKVALLNQDATYFYHLGDYEVPTYLLSPFTFVKGNCDFLSDAPTSLDFTIDYDLKVHLEHGNRINFLDFENYVKRKNCNIFLYGHTHKKDTRKIKDTFVFNPGSLVKPRDDSFGSYLIINVNQNKNISYEFKSSKDL